MYVYNNVTEQNYLDTQYFNIHLLTVETRYLRRLILNKVTIVITA